MVRPLLALAVLLLSNLSVAATGAPRGIFSASGATNPQVHAHPEARGVLIRAGWENLEPQPGLYDFTFLNVQIMAARNAGMSWSLAVSGSDHPAWLRETLGAESFTILFHDEPKVIPKAWDPVVRSRLALLAQALGEAYAADPSLALVYVPQMTANGIEGHFNGVPEETLTAAGYTEDLWVESVLNTAGAFAAAFPTQALAVELHEILDSVAPAQRILDGLWEDTVFGGRAGGACWWLSGRTDYQADLLDVLAAYPGALFCQLIAPSNQPERFLDGDLSTALLQARQLGSDYVEAWEYEFTSSASDAALAGFNASVDGTVGVREASPALDILTFRAHPNPFNPRTTLSVKLTDWTSMVIAVFDVAGRRVRTLYSGEAGPGTITVDWDGRDFAGRVQADGSYVAQVRTPESRATVSLRLIR